MMMMGGYLVRRHETPGERPMLSHGASSFVPLKASRFMGRCNGPCLQADQAFITKRALANIHHPSPPSAPSPSPGPGRWLQRASWRLLQLPPPTGGGTLFRSRLRSQPRAWDGGRTQGGDVEVTGWKALASLYLPHRRRHNRGRGEQRTYSSFEVCRGRARQVLEGRSSDHDAPANPSQRGGDSC